jgi:hypothetical protein
MARLPEAMRLKAVVVGAALCEPDMFNEED